MRPHDEPRRPTYRRGGEGGFGGANGVEGDRGEGGLGNIIGELIEGRLNLGFGGNFWVGGGFSHDGRGSLAHGRFLQVQSHVSVKRQAEARSVCMSRVQDRTCVGCNATATGVL